MIGSTIKNCAVLMGDLVGSEKSHSPEKLHEDFNKVVNEQNDAKLEGLISPLTITLGDEFQGLVSSLSKAMPIMRNMRLNLMKKSINCRFVLGTVELKTPINKDAAWNMMGKGLSVARDKLNEKRAGVFYRFSIPQDKVTETLLDALAAGLSLIERDWTEQQRSDITELLSGVSPEDLAETRKVSIHSIYKVRRSGNFEVYVSQWQAITEALAEIDKVKGLT